MTATIDRFSEVQELWAPGELTNRELWRWRVRHTPERRWLWSEGQSWSYREFDDDVRRLAAGLRALGVEAGTRVLVGMSTRPEAVATHLALGQLGAVCVVLVPGMPLDELMFPIVHSEARMMIADDPIASLVLDRREECASIEQLVVLGDPARPAAPGVEIFHDLAQSSPLDHAPLPVDHPQSLSHIVYTSGSTGRPKGVMLKAGSMYHCGLGYADLYAFGASDNYFNPLTFGHSLASIAALGIPMVTGGSVSLTPRFRPSKFWDEVEASEATISVLFPAHLNLLLEVDDGSIEKGSSTLRFVVTHSYIPAFVDRFGVELGMIWGMSETLVCVGSDPGYRGELGPGYVGHPFAGGEVGIFDEQFNRLGPYQHGELCLRHPATMLGYLNDPEATAATLRDGWVRSGDRGYVDHTGRAFFAGRYKAMIKRSGENISAEEVETALVEHPDVSECVVVAVPDRLRTEEVGAVVVRRAGTKGDPASMRRACAERLVRWKLPRYILVLDEPLPRLGNGKIDRTSAAAMIDPEAVWDAEKS
jgi:acyl-CoA synthetase (AMP-forming)/AMP-acid ligase II